MGRPATIYKNGQHTCSMCRGTKPLDAFSYRDKARGKLQARCKACCAEVFRNYRLNNIDKFREYKRMQRPENRERAAELRRKRKQQAPEREFMRKRQAYLRTQFGITHEDYELRLVAQGGVCAICGTDDPGRKSPYFHVDHCHATNVVRGLLCNGCNLGLGHFKDNKSRLSAAIAYLDGVRDV